MAKKFCSTIASTVLFLGLLGSYFWAKENGMEMGLYKLERNWGLTITIFLTGVLVICMSVSILYGIAEIIDNQEKTYYCLKSIEKSLVSTEKEVKNKEPLKISSDTKMSGAKDAWECKECGRMNANYIGTCACGNTKDKKSDSLVSTWNKGV